MHGKDPALHQTRALGVEPHGEAGGGVEEGVCIGTGTVSNDVRDIDQVLVNHEVVTFMAAWAKRRWILVMECDIVVSSGSVVEEVTDLIDDVDVVEVVHDQRANTVKDVQRDRVA